MILALFFLLTIAIEIPIAMLFFSRKKRKEAARVCLILNLFTWPVLHILYYSSFINTDADILKLEMAIAVAEGFGYWIMLKCGWYKGFIISILANAATYGAGILITRMMHEPVLL